MPFTIADADALLGARIVADRDNIPEEVTAVAGIVIPAAKEGLDRHSASQWGRSTRTLTAGSASVSRRREHEQIS